jgi:hypothetical protein
MAQPFDRLDASLYTSIPRIKPQSGVALTRAVLVALPKDAPDRVKLAARAVRSDAIALQAANRATAEAAAAATSPRNGRVVDNEADALHGALRRRLADHALVAGYDPELADTAAALETALYPDNGAFTRGDMLTQWQGTEEWFGRLREAGREKALRALVGDAFADAIATVHAEYGEVVGTTKPKRTEPAKIDVATPLAAVAQGLQDLALQLVALANDRSATEAQRAASRAALAPIDRHRASNARRGAAKATPAEPVAEPKPEVKGEVKPTDADEPLPEV